MNAKIQQLAWIKTLLAIVCSIAFATSALAAPKAPQEPAAVDEQTEKAAADKPAVKDASPAGGDEGGFIQFINDKKGGGRLKAAIATFENKKGVKVTLISALHVGEASYYDSLSKSFPEYDALLYEMVKPKGAPAPQKGAKSGSAIGGIQRFIENVLELDYQL